MRLIDADALKKALANMWYDSPVSVTGISVSELIDSQPTIEPSDGDLISRQDALNLSCEITGRHGDEGVIKACFEAYRDHIKRLPTARLIRQTDALIIADALRYLEQDEERHEMDRATATSLRERILQYGASLSARPTGDVVEVVRCKDCKHRDPEDKKCDCGHDILWQLPRPDDWFCGDAEMEVEHE